MTPYRYRRARRQQHFVRDALTTLLLSVVGLALAALAAFLSRA